MSSLLIAFGILASAMTPTIAVVVGYLLNDKKVKAVKEDLSDAREGQIQKHEETTQQLGQIQVLVNGRMAEALDRIQQLETALGIEPHGQIPK